jgi:hypothetical protein
MEEMLYSAEIVREGGRCSLYVRDHTSDVVQGLELSTVAIDKLPKYLAMLKLHPVHPDRGGRAPTR